MILNNPFSRPTDTQSHRAGEGLAVGRSLLNPIDNPIVNPFQSETITLRSGDDWIVIIGTQLTVILDENLDSAYEKAISNHYKKISGLL